MTEELLQKLFDACFYGKQITELLPPLPEKMKSRHVDVIATIHGLLEKQGSVRVGDVSAAMRVTTPSVTKLIGELEALGVVEKHADREDKRVTTVTLTPVGMEYYNFYIRYYHSKLIQLLGALNEEDCLAAIRTMENMYRIMREHPITITKDTLRDRKGMAP